MGLLVFVMLNTSLDYEESNACPLLSIVWKGKCVKYKCIILDFFRKMTQKIWHVVDYFDTFRHFRFKNTEGMCQCFTGRKILQVIRGIMLFECFGKVQCIVLEHIILAGNQIAGRQIFRNCRMFRIGLGSKWSFSIAGTVKKAGKKQPDLVQLPGVEHSAD